MRNKIKNRILEFEKEIKEIEDNGHGLKYPELTRKCNKNFCKDCQDIGILYIKNNLLKELLE